MAESTRIKVTEIMERLDLGEQTIYAMLEAKEIPALRINKRWIISRYAYLEWEKRFGTTAKPVEPPPFQGLSCQ